MNPSPETTLMLAALNLERPDALFKKAQEWQVITYAYKVTSPEAALAAGEDLKLVKALARQLEEKRTAITGPINKALKEVNALFKPAQEWLAEAERLLKSALLGFQADQNRIAREAQAKADQEARKEREKLEQQAARAEIKGKIEKAEELRDQAQAQVAPIVSSAEPKLSGIVTRETWKAEVTDKLAFVKHVVEARPDLIALILIDQASLNAQARSLKDALDLPGVRAVKETILAARGNS
jgi:colicin import membrane protein